MFGFIRNIFRSNLSEEQDDWNWLQEACGERIALWSNFSSSSNGRYEHLTQRDLQMIQHIMSKHIKAADQVRKEIKEDALGYEVKDYLRHLLFKEHREVKAYLKKLAALQHRLKHKIAARG